jgi:hypothetical protein
MKNATLTYYNNDKAALVIDWADRQYQGQPFNAATLKNILPSSGSQNQIQQLLEEMSDNDQLKKFSNTHFISNTQPKLTDSILQLFPHRYATVSKQAVKYHGIHQKQIDQALAMLVEAGKLEVNPFNLSEYRLQEV